MGPDETGFFASATGNRISKSQLWKTKTSAPLTDCSGSSVENRQASDAGFPWKKYAFSPIYVSAILIHDWANTAGAYKECPPG